MLGILLVSAQADPTAVPVSSTGEMNGWDCSQLRQINQDAVLG